MRYAVPVAVAGVAAATIGLVPAFAGGSSGPDLPKISAEDLIAGIAKSDVRRLSGTVKISTDLGLPSLPGGEGVGAGAFGSGSAKSGGGAGEGGDGASSADPRKKLMELASGTHTLRVAADGPEKQRVSIVDKAAEYSMIHNGGEVWAYNSADNTAYHAKALGRAADRPHAEGERGGGLPKELRNATPQDLAKKALAAAGDTTSVTVDGTARIAGRDAYQLKIAPKQSGSTIEAIRIAVDADNGVPLKFTLSPKSGGAAVIEAGFTTVDFAKPPADSFSFTPPKGAKVVEAEGLAKGDVPSRAEAKDRAGEALKELERGGAAGLDVIGKGWTSVVELKGSGAGKGASVDSREGLPPEASRLMDSLGDKVSGDFGSGHVFSTRLVNALMTQDGKVFVGAVDKQTLIDAANKAK